MAQTRIPLAKLWDGKKLRACRERMQLTLSEMARRSGLADYHISSFEGGQRGPELRTLRGLIDVLEMDLFDLDELLRLNQVGPQDLKMFRAACKVEGRKPIEALRDIIILYIQRVKEKKIAK